MSSRKQLNKLERSWDSNVKVIHEPRRVLQMSEDIWHFVMRSMASPVEKQRLIKVQPQTTSTTDALKSSTSTFDKIAGTLGFRHHVGSDPQLELRVVKVIMIREGLLSNLRFLAAKSQQANFINGNRFVELLAQLRETTLNYLEALCLWRQASAPDATSPTPAAEEEDLHRTLMPRAFLWEGRNYTLKLLHDLDFLAEYPIILDSLQLSPQQLLLNPLMLSNNLEDFQTWMDPYDRALLDVPQQDAQDPAFESRLRLRLAERILLQEMEMQTGGGADQASGVFVTQKPVSETEKAAVAQGFQARGWAPPEMQEWPPSAPYALMTGSTHKISLVHTVHALAGLGQDLAQASQFGVSRSPERRVKTTSTASSTAYSQTFTAPSTHASAPNTSASVYNNLQPSYLSQSAAFLSPTAAAAAGFEYGHDSFTGHWQEHAHAQQQQHPAVAGAPTLAMLAQYPKAYGQYPVVPPPLTYPPMLGFDPLVPTAVDDAALPPQEVLFVENGTAMPLTDDLLRYGEELYLQQQQRQLQMQLQYQQQHQYQQYQHYQQYQQYQLEAQQQQQQQEQEAAWAQASYEPMPPRGEEYDVANVALDQEDNGSIHSKGSVDSVSEIDVQTLVDMAIPPKTAVLAASCCIVLLSPEEEIPNDLSWKAFIRLSRRMNITQVINQLDPKLVPKYKVMAIQPILEQLVTDDAIKSLKKAKLPFQEYTVVFKLVTWVKQFTASALKKQMKIGKSKSHVSPFKLSAYDQMTLAPLLSNTTNARGPKKALPTRAKVPKKVPKLDMELQPFHTELLRLSENSFLKDRILLILLTSPQYIDPVSPVPCLLPQLEEMITTPPRLVIKIYDVKDTREAKIHVNMREYQLYQQEFGNRYPYDVVQKVFQPFNLRWWQQYAKDVVQIHQRAHGPLTLSIAKRTIEDMIIKHIQQASHGHHHQQTKVHSGRRSSKKIRELKASIASSAGVETAPAAERSDGGEGDQGIDIAMTILEAEQTKVQELEGESTTIPAVNNHENQLDSHPDYILINDVEESSARTPAVATEDQDFDADYYKHDGINFEQNPDLSPPERQMVIPDVQPLLAGKSFNISSRPVTEPTEVPQDFPQNENEKEANFETRVADNAKGNAAIKDTSEDELRQSNQTHRLSRIPILPPPPLGAQQKPDSPNIEETGSKVASFTQETRASEDQSSVLYESDFDSMTQNKSKDLKHDDVVREDTGDYQLEATNQNENEKEDDEGEDGQGYEQDEFVDDSSQAPAEAHDDHVVTDNDGQGNIKNECGENLGNLDSSQLGNNPPDFNMTQSVAEDSIYHGDDFEPLSPSPNVDHSHSNIDNDAQRERDLIATENIDNQSNSDSIEQTFPALEQNIGHDNENGRSPDHVMDQSVDRNHISHSNKSTNHFGHDEADLFSTPNTLSNKSCGHDDFHLPSEKLDKDVEHLEIHEQHHSNNNNDNNKEDAPGQKQDEDDQGDDYSLGFEESVILPKSQLNNNTNQSNCNSNEAHSVSHMINDNNNNNDSFIDADKLRNDNIEEYMADQGWFDYEQEPYEEDDLDIPARPSTHPSVKEYKERQAHLTSCSSSHSTHKSPNQEDEE